MRIVSIPVISGIPQYQDFGGIQHFGANEVIGDACIGVYTGPLSEEDLPTYVTPDYRPIVTIVDISSTDPEVIWFPESGLISNISAGTGVHVIATIQGYPSTDPFNMPIHRNGSLEGYFLVTPDEAGDISFDMDFPFMGHWELSEDILNTGQSPAESFRMEQVITAKVQP